MSRPISARHLLVTVAVAAGWYAPVAAQQVTTAPSAQQVQTQANAVLRLDSLQLQVQTMSATIAQLEDSVRAIRLSTQESRAARAADSAAAARALQAARKRKAEAEAAFRRSVLMNWGQNTVGFLHGLKSAGAVSAIAFTGEVYHPEKARSVSGVLDLLARAATAGGALYGGMAHNASTGLIIGGVGLALTHVFGIKRTYTASDQARLQAFVERAAMHKQFNGDVDALKISVDSIIDLLQPFNAVATGIATDCSANPACDPTSRLPRVTHAFVNDFSKAVDSYTTLISAMAHANSMATRLLADTVPTAWSPEVRNNLVGVQKRTADAITAWRDQIVISQYLIENLRKLADVDDAPGKLAGANAANRATSFGAPPAPAGAAGAGRAAAVGG